MKKSLKLALPVLSIVATALVTAAPSAAHALPSYIYGGASLADTAAGWFVYATSWF